MTSLLLLPTEIRFVLCFIQNLLEVCLLLFSFMGQMSYQDASNAPVMITYLEINHTLIHLPKCHQKCFSKNSCTLSSWNLSIVFITMRITLKSIGETLFPIVRVPVTKIPFQTYNLISLTDFIVILSSRTSNTHTHTCVRVQLTYALMDQLKPLEPRKVLPLPWMPRKPSSASESQKQESRQKYIPISDKGLMACLSFLIPKQLHWTWGLAPLGHDWKCLTITSSNIFSAPSPHFLPDSYRMCISSLDVAQRALRLNWFFFQFVYSMLFGLNNFYLFNQFYYFLLVSLFCYKTHRVNFFLISSTLLFISCIFIWFYFIASTFLMTFCDPLFILTVLFFTSLRII